MKSKYYIFKMNTTILNVCSVILFIIILLITLFIRKDLLIQSLWINDYLMFIVEMILYTIMHEVLHSIGYVINGAQFKNIYYGAALEKGILYCLCKQRISKRNILISLMFPFVFIGILTYIFSLVFNLPRLLILSIINISGCTGDIIMFMFISKIKNIEFSEFDSEDSFALYTKDDIGRSSFGIDYIETTDKLKIGNNHRINVSRVSVVVFAVLMILGLFTL